MVIGYLLQWLTGEYPQIIRTILFRLRNMSQKYKRDYSFKISGTSCIIVRKS